MIAAGAVIEWLVVAALAVGTILFARRYGGGTALEHLQTTNQVLEETVREQSREIDRLRRRVSELEGKTDLTLAIVPVLEALRTHELRAAERSSATLEVLHELAASVKAERG